MGQPFDRRLEPVSTMTQRRVCLLTGAAGRFGTAFLEKHLGHYAFAAVVHRAPITAVGTDCARLVDPLAPAAKLPENSGEVFQVRADLSTPAGVEYAVELALARYGRIDVVVNAATYWQIGGLLHTDAILDTAPEQLWLNTIMPVKLGVEVARQFWRSRADENRRENRNIINISTTSAGRQQYNAGQSLYSASKAALNVASAHMAAEFELIGVRVNAVTPRAFHALPADKVAELVRQIDEAKYSGKICLVDERGLTPKNINEPL